MTHGHHASCAICHDFTNHTTEQHEALMAPTCVGCEGPVDWDDPEATKCRACCADEGEYLSEQASYYIPDERA